MDTNIKTFHYKPFSIQEENTIHNWHSMQSDSRKVGLDSHVQGEPALKSFMEYRLLYGTFTRLCDPESLNRKLFHTLALLSHVCQSLFFRQVRTILVFMERINITYGGVKLLSISYEHVMFQTTL